MLTFLGKGYTPEFVVNYGRIVGRLNAGEDIEIVAGPDEICLPMLAEQNCHCHNDSVLERDRISADEIGKLLGMRLKDGDRFVLTKAMLAELRSAFALGTIRTACEGCEWHDLCSEIAQNKFSGCRLACR